MKARKAVTVIGIGDDGCGGLSARAFNAIKGAQVLVGGARQLAFFPEFAGQRLQLKKGLKTMLPEIAQLADEHNVCILASGDPLFFGIGALIVKVVGSAHVDIIPAPSTMQWAFAKVGLSWEDAALLSIHGRPFNGLINRLRHERKAAILTDSENSPQRLAMALQYHDQDAWQLWVLEHLLGPEERVRSFSVSELAQCTDIAPLNLVIMQRLDPEWREPALLPFLPEEEFAKRVPKLGLISKREVRLVSLAQLGLRRQSVVWDIGAGSGSVAIEAAMLANAGRVYAIECDPEGVSLCEQNCRAHGTDNVQVIAGLAPGALEGLEAPDAVFIGGSKGSMRPMLKHCWDVLKPGGKIVVNAVTLDNVSEAYQGFRDLGLWPELIVLNISRGAPLANRYLRYEALNPIHIFAVHKKIPEINHEYS